MVATVGRRLSLAHAATLKPGRRLRLTTEFELRPLRAAVQARESGTYTIEVQDGGYTAATVIKIARF